MKTAAAYVRVSTDKQDEYSLDSQLRLIREYAQNHDMTVPAEYVFVEDGISGRSAQKRPAFQTMVGLAKDKDRPFDAILVWKFSRFARNQEESIVYKSMLARAGVEVISISEPVDDSPFGSLIERIIEWMDEFYSIRLSGEVRRGMAEKISRGEVVTIPSFGYDVKGRTYVQNEHADTVRRIFAEYEAGKGVRTIAQELAAEGVRTRRGSVPGNRWVKYILQNPVYIGKLRWSREGKIDYVYPGENENALLIDGGFEPIVDRETFDRVQQLLQRRAAAHPYTRHEQRAEWMLKGLVRCSACGSTLVRASTACPSMQCHKYAKGSCTVSHSLSIEKANKAVIAELERCADLGAFALAMPEAAIGPGPDYARQLAHEKKKLERVKAAYEAGVDTLAEYAAKKAKISAAIADLEQKQSGAAAAAPSAAAMQARTRDVLEILKSPDVSEAEKNTALRSILSHIVYDKPASRLDMYFSFL